VGISVTQAELKVKVNLKTKAQREEGAGLLKVFPGAQLGFSSRKQG
jgi:hypothetical protein